MTMPVSFFRGLLPRFELSGEIKKRSQELAAENTNEHSLFHRQTATRGPTHFERSLEESHL